MNKNLISFICLITAGTIFAVEPHNHQNCNGEHTHSVLEEKHNVHENEICDHDHDHGDESHKEHQIHNGEEKSHTDEESHNHSNCKNHTPASASDSSGDLIPIEISSRARESIAMRIEKLSPKDTLVARYSYYGQLVVSPTAEKTVSLPIAGRVRFFVKAGQKVNCGDPLFVLSSQEIISMKSDMREAESALERASAELKILKNRLVKLESVGVKNSELEASISFKEVEIKSLAISAERSIALWNQVTSDCILKNNELIIVAKYNGVIQSLDLNEGAWGEQGISILKYIEQGKLEFKTSVYGNDNLSEAKAKLALTINGETNYYEGQLRVLTQLSEKSQTRIVYFQPENLSSDAFVGQIARLEIYTKDFSQKGFVSIPNSAVIKVGVENIVFVCDAKNPNKFIATKVKTLPSKREMTPVLGIKSDATVVVKGGYELKYLLPATANTQKKTAGHFHADGKFHEGSH